MIEAGMIIASLKPEEHLHSAMKNVESMGPLDSVRTCRGPAVLLPVQRNYSDENLDVGSTENLFHRIANPPSGKCQRSGRVTRKLISKRSLHVASEMGLQLGFA